MDTIIKVRCTDQVLTFDNTPVIASGGLEEDFIAFDFCSKWDGFAKTAVFWRTEADAFHVVLDENGCGAIPPEVLQDEGVIYFGVFGVNAAGKQRTSEVLNYRIAKGVITTGTKPSDPTPDIYTQIEAHYAELLGELHVFNEAVSASADAAGAAQEAAQASADAVGAAQEAAQASADAAGAAQEAAQVSADAAGAAQIAAENALKSVASNTNLLINWYFANPVNQRGQTEYTASGNTVDSWVKSATGTVTVADGYVTVGSGVTLQNRQEADVVSAITGRELTFSVLTDTGLLTGTATFTSAKIFCSDDKIALRISGAGNPYIATTADVNIIAVKLELGSVQTLAHQDENGNWVLNDPPPDKGMELLKCCMSTADSTDTYANNKVTPAAINAVNKAGDTMTGALHMSTGNRGGTLGIDPDNDYLFMQYRDNDGAGAANFILSHDKFRYRYTLNGTAWNGGDILHTGNVTAGTADITAGTTALANGCQYLVYE